MITDFLVRLMICNQFISGGHLQVQPYLECPAICPSLAVRAYLSQVSWDDRCVHHRDHHYHQVADQHGHLQIGLQQELRPLGGPRAGGGKSRHNYLAGRGITGR